jgi:hypothetical protein
MDNDFKKWYDENYPEENFDSESERSEHRRIAMSGWNAAQKESTSKYERIIYLLEFHRGRNNTVILEPHDRSDDAVSIRLRNGANIELGHLIGRDMEHALVRFDKMSQEMYPG